MEFNRLVAKAQNELGYTSNPLSPVHIIRIAEIVTNPATTAKGLRDYLLAQRVIIKVEPNGTMSVTLI